MSQNSSGLIDKGAGSLPLILWLLFLMGVISACTILVSFFWLTSRLDQVSAKGSVSLTNVVIEDTIQDLSFTVRDFSLWSLAYEIVQERREDEVIDVLGTSATDSDLFDQLLLLSSDFEVLYEYQSEGALYASGTASLPFLQTILSQLPETESQEVTPLAGYVRLGETYAAVAVSKIVPNYVAEIDTSTLPIMVGLIHLDDNWISNLARHSLQSGHDVGDINPDSSRVGTALNDINGHPVGFVSWDRPAVGKALRQEILGPILGICVVTLIITVGAARFFRSQHVALNQLRRLASTDHLTGILNRAGLELVTGSTETASRIAAGSAAVLYIDLNDFKALNDTLGHTAGDEALQAMAETLKAAVRTTDVVARLGGDEFICLVYNDDPRSAAKHVIDRILSITEKQISLAGETYQIKPSIGVAVAREGIEWGTLLKQADAAMYWAKRHKAERTAFYDESRPELSIAT